MNALLLNDNLKNKALEQLEELYPHEKITFDRWRKCISAYQSGYWTVPENFDEVLANCKPNELISCLDLLNTCISTGTTKDHIRWLFRLFAASKSSLLVEFLLSCAQITEAEQLKKPKLILQLANCLKYAHPLPLLMVSMLIHCRNGWTKSNLKNLIQSSRPRMILKKILLMCSLKDIQKSKEHSIIVPK